MDLDGALHEQVMATLRAADGPLTTEQVARASRLTPLGARAGLRRLDGAGRAARGADGRWSVAVDGRRALTTR